MSRVERIGPDDWRRFRDVRLAALLDAPDAFGSSHAREAAYGEAEWRGFVALGPMWLAVDDGRDVGMVSGGTSRDTGEPWVFAMWVEPASRGRGIAAQLLDAVVGWARTTGYRRVGLDVTDRAPAARRCYERYGFVANGVTKPLDRDRSISLAELHYDLGEPA